MAYQIALPAEIDVTPAEFVATWNEEPESMAAAEAHLETPPAGTYDPLILGGAAVAVLGSVAVGLATSALYDLIKHVLTKRGATQQIELNSVDLDDGSVVIVIEVVEP